MTRKRNRKPTHPGTVLHEDVLQSLDMSISEAARILGVSRKHLSNFCHGHTSCSKDLAGRLSHATNTSIAVWLNMQHALDVWEAEHIKFKEHDKIVPFEDIKAA